MLNLFKKFFPILSILFIIFTQNCHFIPRTVPTYIESFEGYASLRVKNSQILKSKIAFLFFKDKGRVDILGLLGSTRAQIFLHSNISYFLLPKREVYWAGPSEKIMKTFLGFNLNMSEIKAFLTGQWKNILSEESFEKWKFLKDKDGKVIGGSRESFIFEIKEFFKGTSIPKKIIFSSLESNGKIKIFTLKFNQPIKPSAFSKFFLKYYEKKTLDEIMELLENGN